MLPTIAIDCRFAASPLGLGRYVRELVSRMVQSKEASFTLLLTGSDHAWLGDIGEHCRLINVDIPHYSIAEQLRLPRLLARIHPDVYFVPHFNALVLSPIPTVITVHDLILHHYPNEASIVRQLAYRSLIGAAIRRARTTVAVSSFVREELIARYGLRAAQKTIVIPEGVSSHFSPQSEAHCAQVLERYGMRTPYFLYVGSAKEHKNVPMLIQTFQKAQVPECMLVLVTGGREAHSLHPLPPFVRMISDVPEADMPALYSAARAFVTASLYEGYGLPVAEALACGCPVIASNRTAIPEVANGHAQLVEPEVDSFAHALRNPPLRGGPFRVASWEKAAARTLEALMAACASPARDSSLSA